MPRKHKTQKKGKSYKKGGCVTCSAKPFLVGGGDFNTPSFEKLNQNHYYPLNNYRDDPTHTSLSTRIMKGGRRRTAKKSKRINRRKMTGGVSDFLQGSAFNVVNAHGTTSGVTIASNALTGNMNMQNPSHLEQPVSNKYNALFTPLA